MDKLSLELLRPIFTQLSFIDRLPLSRVNRYFHEVFLKLYPSPLQVLIEEFEYFGYDPTTLKLLFEKSPLPIKTRGLTSEVETFISGKFLARILHRDIRSPVSFGTTHLYTFYRLKFIRVIRDGKEFWPCSKNRTIDGRILEGNKHYCNQKKGIFYYENTIPCPTSDVPEFFFDLDFELGPIMMSRERFYIQDSYEMRVRAPTKLVDRIIYCWLREQILDGVSLILSSAKKHSSVNVPPLFLTNQFSLCYDRMIYGYENLRNRITDTSYDCNIDCTPREQIKSFFWLWLDCIMRYDLPIFSAALGQDQHYLYRHLEFHRMSSYQLNKVGSVGAYRRCHKVVRIYPHIREWQLRYYDIILPQNNNLSIGCYNGPFDIEMIRRHFIQ